MPSIPDIVVYDGSEAYPSFDELPAWAVADLLMREALP
jgi:hypothetical protein